MTRVRTFALLALVSALFHLKGIGNPPLDYHYHRQANTALIARKYSMPGSRFLYPQNDWEGGYNGKSATEFPLYMWLVGKLWPLFGLAELWGRVLSALFSIVGAWYLFLFLGRRFSFAESLAASLAFCAMPLEVYFGRTIQPEALALACTLAALYHWDRFLDESSALDWAAATLATFLAVGLKLPYAFLLLALAGQTFFKRGAKAFLSPAVLAAPAVALAGVAAWYKWASTGSYVVPTHGHEFWHLLDYSKELYYTQFQFLSRLPELVTTWPGMIFSVIGAAALWKRGERFLFWWWAAVAVSLVCGGGYTFFHEYTSLPMAPVMAAFLGAGLVAAWNFSPRMKGFAAALVAAMLIMGQYRIKHWYYLSYPHLARAAEAADAVSAPADLFVCNDRAPAVTLFYLRRRGWCWGFNENKALMREADNYAGQGAKFLMSASADLNAEERAQLLGKYARVYEKDGIEIYRLAAPAIAANRTAKKR